MRSSSILYLTQFTPSAVGHGGQHRSYQITCDLREILGHDLVHVLSQSELRESFQASPPEPLFVQIRNKLQRRFRYYTENPWRLRREANFFPSGWMPSAMVDRYRQMLSEIGKPALVVIEHTGFAGILDINIAQGIPTVACVQNLESLDLGRTVTGMRPDTAVRMGDLAVEIGILSSCSERLFISKVEAGLIGGVGLRARYYPYLPVGEIRENLCRIRRERAKSAGEPGLFLMVGSAGHHTTKEAFSWFVQQAQTYGLPPGVRVVIGGSETDQLVPGGVTVPGLEVRGRLSQEELDRLLIIAQAVLVPQFRGFGALTRLPELACAGIPTFVSRHPTYAIDIPPGVHVVEDRWEAWCSVMNSSMWTEPSSDLTWAAYMEWEESQPRALTSLLGDYHLGT